MVYIVFSCLSIPLLLMLPLLESRSRWIIGFFLLGAFTALAAYEINTIAFPLSGLDSRSFSEKIPPMVEELLKLCRCSVTPCYWTTAGGGCFPSPCHRRCRLCRTGKHRASGRIPGRCHPGLGGSKRFFRQPDARSLHGQHRHWHLLCKKTEKTLLYRHLWLTVHRNHHACPL